MISPTHFSIDTGTILVYIRGSADVPDSFAQSTSSTASARVRLLMGGESRDLDVKLGRPPSEMVYYAVQYVNPKPNRTRWALTTGGGAVVGFNMGDNK